MQVSIRYPSEHMDSDFRQMLSQGLYDQPVTQSLAELLDALGPERVDVGKLPKDGDAGTFARLLYERLLRSLDSLPSEERLRLQIELTNRVLELLQEAAPRGGAEGGDHVTLPGTRLLAVKPDVSSSLASLQAPERPQIPLSTSDLLINAHHDLSVGPELRRELASADRVDLLCSFLKWNGYRVLEDALRNFLDRRPGGLRVLTTTYIGATERRALDELADLGAELKVSYDTGRTRLHAKAWLFHRESGFSTAYIGSSNLSAQALLDGLEWNVRLSNVDNAPILAKFEAAFEQYWADSEFEAYAGSEVDQQHFDKAIQLERHGPSGEQALSQLALSIDVAARPHQQEILDELAAERARGHYRNLVVAATGTGKTVVAALDYRRLCEISRQEEGGLRRPSLLFVAHRDEILRQTQQTFQLVLRDGDFGERLVGGVTPKAAHHVFASIQSLHAGRLQALDPAAYDVIIVDEFHHAAADTYDRLLMHLLPKVLLGLTATPERADGKSIVHHFDDRVASELRLWKALDQGLLSPFQYFGLKGPDVSSVTWKRGRYDVSQLRNVYTGDHVFALRVIQEVRHKVADVGRMRALGFCVDVEHARFMVERFKQAGIPAEAVCGKTPHADRRAALQRLQFGDLRVLFSVDLFNEGVDLPDVDTILFLRPTESATLFLQQLGRGLRRSEGKSCCTVLDFIGDAHRKFRFDQRFRAIVGGTRRYVQKQVQEDFPLLPSGCSIMLDRAAQKVVLDNIKQQLGTGQKGLVEDLIALGAQTDLVGFISETGFDLEDVYERSGCCFTALRQKAGFAVALQDSETTQIQRAFARLLHIDDTPRLQGYRSFLAHEIPPTGDAADPVQRMLFVLLGYRRESFSRVGDAWQALWQRHSRLAELRQLLELLEDRTRRLTLPLPGPLVGLPLQVHGTYSLDEVIAAIDERSSKGGVTPVQSGLLYSGKHRCDLMFVTIEKSEKDYTPTTLYNDYPMSQQVFHWESQSACHVGTPTGRRYTAIRADGPDFGLLFVRQRKVDDRGETMPYLLLGPVTYRTHRGGRPMQIEWQLEYPMPAGDFQEMKVAAG